MRVIMLGPPGAGKGTQAKQIAERYEVPHVSTGDMFRANLQQGTALGEEARSYMDAGDLVPDDVVVRMVDDRIQQADAQRGWVLDGFPRTLVQAQALDQVLGAEDRPIDVVLRFAVDDDEVVERLSGRRVCRECGQIYHVTANPPEQEGVCDVCGGELHQRDDDTEEVIRTRLASYAEDTEPLEQFYDDRGLLRDVPATGEIDEVTERVMDTLADIQPPPD